MSLLHAPPGRRRKSPTGRKDRVGALNELARVSWRPLYGYLVASGKRNEAAKDLVQGFFQSFLVRDVIASFDPTKGKFRSFLLACLKGWGIRSSARGPSSGTEGRPASRSTTSRRRRLRPAREGGDAGGAVRPRLGPLDARPHGRARSRGAEVEGEQAGRRRTRGVTSDNLARPGYAELAAKSGLSENKVRHLLHEFRGRLREAMLEEIRTQTADEDDAKEELKRLFESLGRK